MNTCVVPLDKVTGTQPWKTDISVTAAPRSPSPLAAALPVIRGSVARFGLGFSGGLSAVRSCATVRVLMALDRLSSRTFLPVSGSFWMNFFSTYLERIHDSFSPLRDRRSTRRRSRHQTLEYAHR